MSCSHSRGSDVARSVRAEAMNRKNIILHYDVISAINNRRMPSYTSHPQLNDCLAGKIYEFRWQEV